MTVGCVVLGSSFSKFSAEELTKITRDTPYGTGIIYAYQGTSSFVQFRHGLPHRLLPIQINWRAQAWMWKEFGVQSLLLTSSVGVLDVGVPLYQHSCVPICSCLLISSPMVPYAQCLLIRVHSTGIYFCKMDCFILNYAPFFLSDGLKANQSLRLFLDMFPDQEPRQKQKIDFGAWLEHRSTR